MFMYICLCIFMYCTLGVTNLYKTQLSDEGKDRASVLNPKLHRNETSIENIVFRGRKLYRRGQLLGSGAYAKVGNKFALRALGFQ